MLKTQRLVGVLRVLLALAFLTLLLAQVVVLPEFSGQWADEVPELAHLRWPIVIVAALGLLCVQVVIVCTWRLLTMVRDDRIFSDESLIWVDVILGAMAAAWLLVLGTFVAVVLGPAALSGAILLLLLVAGAVVGLLMVVMRALLRQATMLRTDLDAVI